jgi:RimJ/RimL family protein N-acetyltransferase
VSENYRPMPVSLETDRLLLRLRDEEFAACNLDLIAEHDGGPSFTLAEMRQRLAEQRVHALERGFGFLAIRRRTEGDLIGYCGLLVGHGSLAELEIAYELVPRVHGQGYATEAARAVVDAAFTTGRRRVCSTVRVWNAASLRVLDKLGFRADHSITDERGESVYLVLDA